MATEEIQSLKDFLKILNFQPKEKIGGIWSKIYGNSYEILVILGDSLKSSKIDYGTKIKCYRATTSNFHQPESLVVLECVNRLLEKGYSPENLELEKDWPLGHRTKGYLDILVSDKKGSSFLMIECKTYGEEYRKEKERMTQNGGQLFSYLIQEKTTQYVCLYTSLLRENSIIFENDIVQITEATRESKNQQEAFESWIPQTFETKGIFDIEAVPFNIVFNGLFKKDLRDLTRGDGGYIFNNLERFCEEM